MRKAKTKNAQDENVIAMALINPNAAGIDVGDKMHAVAVPEGRDIKRIQSFGTISCDMEAIVRWLKKCKVETVAMESTGVYWNPIFSFLISKGFEVSLVNAKQVKNVTGRKNDEDDAMWIQRLHSCGLLKSCYLRGD